MLALAVACAPNPPDACAWTQRGFDNTAEALQVADRGLQKAQEGARTEAQTTLAHARLLLDEAEMAVNKPLDDWGRRKSGFIISCDADRYELYTKTVKDTIRDVAAEIAAAKKAVSDSSADEFKKARAHSEEANAKVAALAEFAKKEPVKK